MSRHLNKAFNVKAVMEERENQREYKQLFGLLVQWALLQSMLSERRCNKFSGSQKSNQAKPKLKVQNRPANKDSDAKLTEEDKRDKDSVGYQKHCNFFFFHMNLHWWEWVEENSDREYTRAIFPCYITAEQCNQQSVRYEPRLIWVIWRDHSIE